MLEETGLEIEVGPVIEVFDRITRDEQGVVQYHFVLVDYLCWPAGGHLQAGSDVAEAIFVRPGGPRGVPADGEGDGGHRAGAGARSRRPAGGAVGRARFGPAGTL